MACREAWSSTRGALSALRPQLASGDEVVVVDDASRDGTQSGLALYPWATRLRNESAVGASHSRNIGARHLSPGIDVLLFLDNDVVLAPHALDHLREAMSEPGVAAAGPLSDCAPASQRLPAHLWPPSDARAFRMKAREWQRANARKLREVRSLGSFCLAIRRDIFEAAGGFDEGLSPGGFDGEDLCTRAHEVSPLDFVVAEAAVARHDGGRSRAALGHDRLEDRSEGARRYEARHGIAPEGLDDPFISACLIVRDEEHDLPGCLTSLTGIADEIVVYDTGSSDRTREIAGEAGAIVVEGYWDEDFARARNAALEYCRGEWICWVDADETLSMNDITAFRHELANAPIDLDGYLVSIDNLTGSGTGTVFVHTAARLFRRWRCRWAGRLHEQIVIGANGSAPRLALFGHTRIRHSGYTDMAMARRKKASRNLGVAAVEVEQGGAWQQGFSLISLARSEAVALMLEEATIHAEEGLALTSNPTTVRLGLRTLAEVALQRRRPDDALDYAARLAKHTRGKSLPASLAARACLISGRYSDALAILEALPASEVDEDGFEHRSTSFVHERAACLSALGRSDEAASAYLDALDTNHSLDAHIVAVVEALRAAGHDPVELVAHLPGEQLVPFLGQISQLPPPDADHLLESCLEHFPGDLGVLAASSRVALRLPLDRAMAWSKRLREIGLADACPLMGQARDPDLPAPNRCLAAAAAWRAYQDPQAREVFSAAARGLSTQQCLTILPALEALAPDLAGTLKNPVAASYGSDRDHGSTATGRLGS